MSFRNFEDLSYFIFCDINSYTVHSQTQIEVKSVHLNVRLHLLINVYRHKSYWFSQQHLVPPFKLSAAHRREWMSRFLCLSCTFAALRLELWVESLLAAALWLQLWSNRHYAITHTLPWKITTTTHNQIESNFRPNYGVETINLISENRLSVTDINVMIQVSQSLKLIMSEAINPRIQGNSTRASIDSRSDEQIPPGAHIDFWY